jgi:CSLREA domain-containing protein
MKAMRSYPGNRAADRRLRIVALLSALALMGLSLVWASRPVYAANFTVNSTADGIDVNIGDGLCQTATLSQCTLRAAIQEANSSPGADTITFSVSVGAQVFAPINPLPDIVSPVTIDGTSQPGFAGRAHHSSPCEAPPQVPALMGSTLLPAPAEALSPVYRSIDSPPGPRSASTMSVAIPSRGTILARSSSRREPATVPLPLASINLAS